MVSSHNRQHQRISGSIVASITPFRNKKIDTEALKNFIAWQISQGTEGLVLCGSTGEGLLLSRDERNLVLSTALEAAAGRIPVIAGCGAASTQETLSLVQEAKNLGCQMALVVSPFYVKPSFEGLYTHFAAIADACDLPLIAYNNPGRVCVDMSIELVGRLSSLTTVVALKDSHPDISRATRLRSVVPASFSLLSGEDITTGGFLVHGGDGVISVGGNILPSTFRNLVDCWKKENQAGFVEAIKSISQLYGPLSLEANPGPIKYALSRLGYCAHEYRLPLLPVSESAAKAIDDLLYRLELIERGVIERGLMDNNTQQEISYV